MRNRKVVIINNDKKSLGNLEEILAAGGHDSIVVYDALVAVDVVVQRKPDVILMELKMPHKTGFEIADEINRVFETKKIPIIGMSVLYKDEFGFLLNFCGINGYVQKPFNPLDVIWAIENVTQKSDSLDEEKCLERADDDGFALVKDQRSEIPSLNH